MRLVVTGGRDFNDIELVHRALNAMSILADGKLEIAHGGATGADTLSATWAKHHNVPCSVFAADWKRLGRSAGPARNAEMLTVFCPDVVLAFPGGNGTADCVRKARARNIPIIDMAPFTTRPSEDASA